LMSSPLVRFSSNLDEVLGQLFKSGPNLVPLSFDHFNNNSDASRRNGAPPKNIKRK
jgi:hypothetical protein